MRRERLAVLGIQLPVLPTIVIGGLPGAPDWAPRLERIGLDVVCSGAADDTPTTYAAAASAVPHRPCVAMGAVAGASLAYGAVGSSQGVHVIDDAELVVVDFGDEAGDANQIAAFVLAAAGGSPSRWWVAARGLGARGADQAEHSLRDFVEAVRHVRLYLAKRQFD